MTNRTYLWGNGKNGLTETGYGMRVVDCLDLRAKMNGLAAIATAGHCTPERCNQIESLKSI